MVMQFSCINLSNIASFHQNAKQIEKGLCNKCYNPEKGVPYGKGVETHDFLWVLKILLSPYTGDFCL